MLWEDNYLAHYGIKGQKWGVRRFQNEDGSYTVAGKERYGAQISRKEYREIRRAGKADEKQFRREKKDALRGLKGDERERTEQYYNQLESGMAKSRATLERNAGHHRAAVRFANKAEKLSVTEQKKKTLSPDERKFVQEQGTKLGKEDIQKYESMPDGPEKKKAATRLLKELAEDANSYSEKRFQAFQEGRLKEMEQQELNDAEFLKNESRMGEKAAWLMNKITTESGDWYFGESVTKGFEKYNSKRSDIEDKLDDIRFKSGYKKASKDAEYQRLEQELAKTEDLLMGQVLKDIGFEDTPENRKNIYRYVIWD